MWRFSELLEIVRQVILVSDFVISLEFAKIRVFGAFGAGHR